MTLAPGCKKDPPPPPQEVREYAKASYTEFTDANKESSIRFSDVTSAAGISFVHHNGAFGKKWMPETMGSGGGFLDYNSDGWADLLLVNSSDWPGHESEGPKPTLKLYRNRANGMFEDNTVAAKLNVTLYGMGCTFGDYDNDGDPDIYVTAVGGSHLFRNDRGVFVDVTTEAGVTGADPDNDTPPWSMSATWFDLDRDGRIDLYVANYVKWTPETDLYTTRDGKTKSYATPQQYQGQSGRLYRNLDGVHFEDVTVKAGVFNDDGKSLGVVTADFNDDGWTDLFVANDTVANFLFMNNGDGTFREVGASAGCGYDDAGRARAGMGVDVCEPMNDGTPAIIIGNFSGEPVSLYSQIAPGLYQDIAGPMRLARPTLPCLTFGVLFADFDLDGYQDLALANGHIEPEINAVEKEVTFAQRPQVFRNNGKGAFVDVSESAGEPFSIPIVGRAIASADYDHDGDEDLLITSNDGPAKLLRNDTDHANRNWVKLRLNDMQALGASVTVMAGDLVQRRFGRSSSGYLSQSDSTFVLGLGDHKHIDAIRIKWSPYAVETCWGMTEVNRAYDKMYFSMQPNAELIEKPNDLRNRIPVNIEGWDSPRSDK